MEFYEAFLTCILSMSVCGCEARLAVGEDDRVLVVDSVLEWLREPLTLMPVSASELLLWKSGAEWTR